MTETLATIFWGAMLPFNAECTLEDAARLFDEYLDEGHVVEDITQVIHEVLEVSGFFKAGQV
jgi:hypothetical protein